MDKNEVGFCQYVDAFGNRCNAPLADDREYALCDSHYQVPPRSAAKDVGQEVERFVYFAFAEEVRRVKIGTAKEVAQRFASLCNASPSPLVLLGSIRGGLQVERWFHTELIADRSHLEWFHWTTRVCATIDRALKLGEDAARYLCPAAYQTDRTGEQFSELPRLPNRGRK